MIRKFSLHSLVIVFGMLSLVAVSGMGFAASAWQDEWERVLRAAKSEGKLSLIGPLGGDRRDALSQAFQSKYGIAVEYHPDAGRYFSKAQRRAEGWPISLGCAD